MKFNEGRGAKISEAVAGWTEAPNLTFCSPMEACAGWSRGSALWSSPHRPFDRRYCEQQSHIENNPKRHFPPGQTAYSGSKMEGSCADAASPSSRRMTGKDQY